MLNPLVTLWANSHFIILVVVLEFQPTRAKLNGISCPFWLYPWLLHQQIDHPSCLELQVRELKRNKSNLPLLPLNCLNINLLFYKLSDNYTVDSGWGIQSLKRKLILMYLVSAMWQQLINNDQNSHCILINNFTLKNRYWSIPF